MISRLGVVPIKESSSLVLVRGQEQRNVGSIAQLEPNVQVEFLEEKFRA